MDKKPCRACRQVLPATAFTAKHDGTRTLTCVQCLAKQRLYQQAYQQVYRQTHHEHLAERKRRYREQHKREHSVYQRQYYVNNKERLTARKKAYYQANRDKILARQRRYYHEQQARSANALASPSQNGASKRKKAAVATPQGQ
jgi:hypothetical protein